MADDAGVRRCAWCEAQADAAATSCPACGAALAQRDDLGGLLIPGVTAVHPELAAAAERPLHIGGPSRTQGAASGLVAAAIAPGPAGLVAGAGVVALAASEYLGVAPGGLAAPDLDAVGKPSEAALRMAEQLDGESGSGPAAPSPGVDDSPRNSDNSTRD